MTDHGANAVFRASSAIAREIDPGDDQCAGIAFGRPPIASSDGISDAGAIRAVVVQVLRASGGMNNGAVSQGNRIHVSWLTSATKLPVARMPAGLA